MSLTLHTVICSTRPGRIGPSVAHWFHQWADSHSSFEAQLVDLADFALPVLDEPQHPRLQQYEYAHTRRWSESVAAADAFVFVTPEYNYNPAPALVNALNYIYREWNYKPCAFVSYGGISGGMRAVQTTKLLVTTLKMVPLMEAVTLPMAKQHIDASGNFSPQEVHTSAAQALLDELHRWSRALASMRA